MEKGEIAYQVLKARVRKELHLEPEEVQKGLKELSQETGIPFMDLQKFTKELLYDIINDAVNPR